MPTQRASWVVVLGLLWGRLLLPPALAKSQKGAQHLFILGRIESLGGLMLGGSGSFSRESWIAELAMLLGICLLYLGACLRVSISAQSQSLA